MEWEKKFEKKWKKKLKIKKIYMYIYMNEFRNSYPSIPFNPWAIFALWLLLEVPQKNLKKNQQMLM